MKELITGTVLIRGPKGPMQAGRRIFIIAGVIAVDQEFSLEPENIYAVTDGDIEKLAFGTSDGSVKLTILPSSGVPLPDEYSGYRVDQLLTSNLWRV